MSKAIFYTLLLFSGVAMVCSTGCTSKQPPLVEKNYPDVLIQMSPQRAAEWSEELRKEIAVELAQGLTLSLWANDSLVQDPVAISVDNDGAIYYTHAERITNSEFDIRSYNDWTTTSQSWESVEDRRAFLRETYAPEKSDLHEDLPDLNKDGSHDWRDLTVEKEKVWKVADSDGDGFADQARLFLEDFHEEITDLANGVEFFEDEVFIAVGPDLWRTKDTDGDGRANTTTSISHGYAVHIGFGAHGMSGVTMGPDGRLWWGIGDIGMNVVDQNGKRWKFPNQGVIVRSEIDGSNFEVFSHGHRNTHEFAFDKYGNLISVDNDGDHPGERERLVYIVKGSDSGWRSNWQYGKYNDPDNNDYNVWMDEGLSIPRWEGQAAYILPPIVNYVNGPTGLVYNPGTALNEEYSDHFFVAEFTGTPSNSPIHAFKLTPNGAGFELNDTKPILKGVLPTGLDFGPDGALYMGDWIDGWGAKDAGRMWKLDTEDAASSVLRKEVEALIKGGINDKSLSELNVYLAHPDMRIRQKAQFELVKRGKEGYQVLAARVEDHSNQLARIHALWGIGQLARKDNSLGEIFTRQLQDTDPEIVAQALKLIGDIQYKPAGKQLIPLLSHENARVRFYAAQASGELQNKAAIPAIVQMLETNNADDAWLRHAGAYALSQIGEAAPLVALANHTSNAVRTAAVVALRGMRNEGVARFLQDEDAYIVAEASRAINDDYSIPAAMPALANLLNTTSFDNEVILRRVINANLRLGKEENLDELIRFVQDETQSADMRAEAIATIRTWAKPSPTDRVDGRYRGEFVRDVTMVRRKFSPLANKLINDSSPVVQQAAIRAVKELQLTTSRMALVSQLNNSSAQVRATALDAIGAIDTLEATPNVEDADLLTLIEKSLADKSALVRSKALELLPYSRLPEQELIPLFKKVMQNGELQEKQTALATLGIMGTPAGGEYLMQLFDVFSNGKLAANLQLDLLDALEIHGDETLAKKVEDYYQTQETIRPYASFQLTLEGGDRERGSRIFYNNQAAQCVRCHTIFEYGGDAGPSLGSLGNRMTKQEILTSIINPSEMIAAGYGVVILDLKGETTVAGFYQGEDETIIRIREGKNPVQEIPKTEIVDRIDAASSMPAFDKILSKKEIRDLIAYLSSLE